MATTIKQDFIKLRKLKRESAELNKKAKDKTAEMQMWQCRVYERAQEEDVDAIKSDGTLFTVNEPTEYASMQDRGAFVEWAQENAPELLITKEVGDPLNALVRQRLADNQELPPGVGFYTKETISVRKA